MKKNILLFFSLFIILSCSNNSETVRETQFGKVKGIKENGALVWYSVPYGKASRWQAPQNPDSWSNEYDASKWKGLALQLSGNEVVGSEDCLNLDIYSKENAKDLPVLVFLHGGNNQTGNTKELIGTDMVVKDDIVFVSVNYRLGLLGFNNLPALINETNTTGNYTLLDIALALDWVKNNIASFGGDPENITISGFSAGGRDVMALLVSPIFKGKFQKAIAFSGGMTIADETLSRRQIAKAIAPLAVEDGKAASEEEAVNWLLTSGADVSAYLYSISSERLIPLMGNAGIRMSVFPHLYGDDEVLPKSGFDTEDYNAVPIIMLTGNTEFSMFANGDSYFSSEEMTNYSAEYIEKAKTFAIKYGSKMYAYFNAEASAEKMSEYNYNAPIYLCTINYGDYTSDYKIPTFGAFHGIFIPMLAKEHNYKNIDDNLFASASYKDVSDIFNQYLKNFLYTGDPNSDNLNTWERWNNETHLSMVLDAKDDKAVCESKSVSTTYEDIINEMNNDTELSEELKDKMIKNVMNGRWFSDSLDKYYNNRNLWE
ncbi:carboxylesterase family protein [Brachyspira sp. G79]|uniref:carboxylesterase family protein n=1 Tax=Brachyspira sp. G79 TaxID=1358104 RepID=UPI000BBC65C0|nr:carboxylesterase family protein [Brachyspira sp. G79]PCG20413.1 carboxylesterase [Brachyspira sp. G79]